MKTDWLDIEEKKWEEKIKNIPKVTRRYMRIKMKKQLRKLFGLRLR